MAEHCLPGGPCALPAECEFCWSGPISGTLLASAGWHATGADQSGHVVHAAVLGPHPHVRDTCSHSLMHTENPTPRLCSVGDGIIAFRLVSDLTRRFRVN